MNARLRGGGIDEESCKDAEKLERQNALEAKAQGGSRLTLGKWAGGKVGRARACWSEREREEESERAREGEGESERGSEGEGGRRRGERWRESAME